MQKIKPYYPHLLALLGFVIAALLYFYPVLKGDVIYQSDIVQYTGMAKEQNDFRAETDVEPYWTNAAFGGMPTYQLGAKYPHNYVKKLDSVLRFLPRPADYLFLYFLGFYVLLITLKIDPLKAFFGALAFGFSTYLIIILGVGHNAKAHAIAYMPMVLAGVLLVFNKKYIKGGLLTMVAAALELQANHFQMTYYLLILLLIVALFYTYNFIKTKEYKALTNAFGVFVLAGILAVGANATGILATKQYADFSTRSKSELKIGEDGLPKDTQNAMSYDYITEYSYGIAESLNLISPRLFGGANGEKLTTDSEMFAYFTSRGVPPAEAVEYLDQMPTYWGDQPIVAAPAYIGVVVFFFAVLALFIEKRKIKYMLVAGVLVSLLLSWGKNFAFLTDIFINYIPLYNKFRAVSSIQVVLELCMPVLAILGFSAFFKLNKEEQFTGLKKTAIAVGGLLVALFIGKGLFSFTGLNDAYYTEQYGFEFMQALIEDRKQLFTSDILRSILFVLALAAVLWFFIKSKLDQNKSIVLLGLIMVLDLVLVAKNYVNKDDFVKAYNMNMPFEPTQADKMIATDTSHFRVYEPQGAMASARSSYFHKSIGGYSAVKPRRMQQLYDYQIAKNNVGVLNMLNVKYVIQPSEEGGNMAFVNPGANGNAWFVNNIKFVNTADEEMQALDSLNTKKEAVFLLSHIYDSERPFATTYKTDSLATIKVEKYSPNRIVYQSINTNKGFAVFSEMYYDHGWEATIDGKKAEIFRVNYALRGLKVPAGKHKIEFVFNPKVVQTGSTIALFSSLIILLLLLGGFYKIYKFKS